MVQVVLQELEEQVVLQELAEQVVLRESLVLRECQVMMVQIVQGGSMIFLEVLVQHQIILLQTTYMLHRLPHFILIITRLMELILIIGGQP
jgi:hypothetical protein